jgi:hypothetical protein
MLLQNPYDLFFREPGLTHRRSPRDRLNYHVEEIPGSRSGAVLDNLQKDVTRPSSSAESSPGDCLDVSGQERASYQERAEKEA